MPAAKNFKCGVCEKACSVKEIRVVLVAKADRSFRMLQHTDCDTPSEFLGEGYDSELEFFVCEDCVQKMSFKSSGGFKR